MVVIDFMLSNKFVKENPEYAEKFRNAITEASSRSYQDIVKKYLH